jgi:hypothetical protein
MLVIDTLGNRIRAFLPLPQTNGFGFNQGDSLFAVCMGCRIIRIWNSLDSLCGNWVFSDSFNIDNAGSITCLSVRFPNNSNGYIYDTREALVYSSNGTLTGHHLFPNGTLLMDVKSPDSMFVLDSTLQRYEILDKNWQPYSKFTPALGIYNKDQACHIYDDSTIMIYGSSWTLLGGAISWINIKTGALVARLKVNPTSFDVDLSRRIYANGGRSTVNIFDGQIR